MGLTESSPHLSYTQAGEAGPRVLFIMGYGMPGSMWKPQVDELQRSCQVVYFDNRGVGDSDAIGESLSMADMASDALRVLDAVGWHEEVHLVGVSMGGMIAQEVALRAPERLSSLSLIATHAGGRGAVVPPARGIVHALSLGFGPARKRTQTLAKLLYPKSYLESCNREALHARMRAQTGTPAPRDTMRKQLRAIRGHNTRSRLGTLQVPTLVVKPAKDILVNPKHSDYLHKRIPGASLMQISDAGHGLIFQSARQINQRLLEHFRSA